jgi:hypothetical protein
MHAVTGLQYIHDELRLVHGGVKLNNLLLEEQADGTCVVKLVHIALGDKVYHCSVGGWCGRACARECIYARVTNASTWRRGNRLSEQLVSKILIFLYAPAHMMRPLVGRRSPAFPKTVVRTDVPRPSRRALSVRRTTCLLSVAA